MKLLLLTLLAMTSIATAAEFGGRDSKGNPRPDSPSQQTVEGFSGLLIVTPDEDWEEKWNTPSDVAPHFSRGSVVERGGKLFILTMYSNPKLGATDQADITVNLNVRRPDGSSSVHANDADCYKGRIHGSLEHIYLCNAVIEFFGEPSDIAGVWSVEVDLNDKVRKVTVPLSAMFTLK